MKPGPDGTYSKTLAFQKRAEGGAASPLPICIIIMTMVGSHDH